MRLHYRVPYLAALVVMVSATTARSTPPSVAPIPKDATPPAPTMPPSVESPTASDVPVLATPGGTATPSGTRRSSTRPGWSTYTDNRYGVAFPVEWDVPRLEYYGPRFEGGSGFVMVEHRRRRVDTETGWAAGNGRRYDTRGSAVRMEDVLGPEATCAPSRPPANVGPHFAFNTRVGFNHVCFAVADDLERNSPGCEQRGLKREPRCST